MRKRDTIVLGDYDYPYTGGTPYKTSRPVDTREIKVYFSPIVL